MTDPVNMNMPISRGLRRGAGLAVFGAVLASVLPSSAAAAGSCAHANTPVGAASSRQIKAAVVCLINQQRVQRGLPKLHANRKLNHSAQHWTNTMVRRQEFTHGLRFWTRISAVGYDWSSTGENIAVGYTTPSSVVKAWMDSRDHCRNILTPSFAQVGTGVLNQGIGLDGAATWTQDFGLLMGHRAPSHRSGPMNGCPYVI